MGIDGGILETWLMDYRPPVGNPVLDQPTREKTTRKGSLTQKKPEFWRLNWGLVFFFLCAI